MLIWEGQRGGVWREIEGEEKGRWSDCRWGRESCELRGKDKSNIDFSLTYAAPWFVLQEVQKNEEQKVHREVRWRFLRGSLSDLKGDGQKHKWGKSSKNIVGEGLKWSLNTQGWAVSDTR